MNLKSPLSKPKKSPTKFLEKNTVWTRFFVGTAKANMKAAKSPAEFVRLSYTIEFPCWPIFTKKARSSHQRLDRASSLLGADAPIDALHSAKVEARSGTLTTE